MRRKVASALSLLLLVIGGVQGWQGAWIYLKAEFAQLLLERAWAKTQAGGARVRPWSWADAWPVARIILPHGEHVVLSGASGRNLAFAPGHLHGSAPPGGEGACVIAGHRDTHFAELARLEPGDLVRLEDADGSVHRYRVTGAEVVDRTDTRVLVGDSRSTLVLVTCWPFDAVVPGGPLRYVVRAEMDEPLGIAAAAETEAVGRGSGGLQELRQLTEASAASSSASGVKSQGYGRRARTFVAPSGHLEFCND